MVPAPRPNTLILLHTSISVSAIAIAGVHRAQLCCHKWPNVGKALPAADKCLVHGSLRGLHPAILSQYGLESVPAVHHGVSCCFILDGPVASHVLGVVSKFAWRALPRSGAAVCVTTSQKSHFSLSMMAHERARKARRVHGRFCGEFLYLSQIQHHVWIVLKTYTVNLGTLVGIQVRQKYNMLELPVRSF